MDTYGTNWTDPPEPLDGDHLPWVDVRFDFLKLTHIDTVKTCAFIKLRVFLHWTDKRLVDWKGELPGQLWGPVFNLANSLGDMVTLQDEFSLMDATTGRVRRVHLYEGNVDNHMELADFPLDLDNIEIKFTVRPYLFAYTHRHMPGF
jgi:hypothetical protein